MQKKTLYAWPIGVLVDKPKDVIDKELVLHLLEDDIYLTVKFKSWSQGKKGGFSYERSTP